MLVYGQFNLVFCVVCLSVSVCVVPMLILVPDVTDLQMRHFRDSSFPVCLSVSAPQWPVSLLASQVL